jgi:hypothetical protein
MSSQIAQRRSEALFTGEEVLVDAQYGWATSIVALGKLAL